MTSAILLLFFVTLALNLMTWPKTIEAWEDHSSVFWAVFALVGMIVLDVSVIAVISQHIAIT
jgi:hypothetical protein